MNTRIIVLFSLIIMFAFALVGQEAGEAPHFDSDACSPKSQGYALVVCFDLRDDIRLRAGLLERITPTSQITRHVVVLPFAVSGAGTNVRVGSMSGLYSEYTVIGFGVAPDGPRDAGISFVPVPQDSIDASQQLESPDKSLYFVKSGLERLFVYNFRPSISNQSGFATDTPDAVGVAQPAGATGLRVTSNRVEEPDAEDDNGTFRFYPTSLQRNPHQLVKIRYLVTATTQQKLVLEYGLKLFGVILAPLVTILFFKLSENARPTIRLWFLRISVVLEVIILATLIWFAFQVRDESAIRTSLEASVALVGAGLTALAIWLKK